ncbi:hypothetical protein [Leeuwenhoekiella sp. LLG6367-2.1]|uniref:hypothetical protein n=1 Tax=Leeuwenhoekiella sp. LLG6367-2.1 TaxID=3160833 RepID=UPI00386B3277
MNIDSKTKHLVESGVKQIVFPGYCKKVAFLGSSGISGSSGKLVNTVTYVCLGEPILGSSEILGSSKLRITSTI